MCYNLSTFSRKITFNLFALLVRTLLIDVFFVNVTDFFFRLNIFLSILLSFGRRMDRKKKTIKNSYNEKDTFKSLLKKKRTNMIIIFKPLIYY